MGTPIRFLGWVPYQGLGTPHFLPTFPWRQRSSATLGGLGPVSLNSGYGSTHRSIDCGVPLRKGTGVF
jgi:hypothetical protein